MWKILLYFFKKVGIRLMKETIAEYTRTCKIDSYKDVLKIIPDDFTCDGCSFSPDSFSCCGTITDVCKAHDYLYQIVGGSEEDRIEADSVLRRGIIECAQPGKFNYFKTRWIAYVYWRAVRRMGKYFFHYTDGTKMAKVDVSKIPAQFEKLKERAKKILKKENN